MLAWLGFDQFVGMVRLLVVLVMVMTDAYAGSVLYIRFFFVFSMKVEF